jgi:catechol 2,3-dioxygenase-like lactoylglutathione lyase family enzyme
MTDELRLTIDHVTLSVDNLDVAKSFYGAALEPLGLELVAEIGADITGTVAFAGFGIGRKGTLWLAQRGQQTPATHICFRASSRAAVEAFHAAALAAGATDNGGPGVRPQYHPSYYAAFVLDPEGHNIEAVTFAEAGA